MQGQSYRRAVLEYYMWIVRIRMLIDMMHFGVSLRVAVLTVMNIHLHHQQKEGRNQISVTSTLGTTDPQVQSWVRACADSVMARRSS